MAFLTSIKLGTQEFAEILFTYPNDGHEADSLEDTIKHYVLDSLRREGIGGFAVNLRVEAGIHFIDIQCETAGIANAIGARYGSFFDIGGIGHTAAEAFQTNGSWDAAWKFLLPLGLPMEFARAIEIMDFPPLSLIKKQDYLNSKTTNRWWELLILNGVSNAEKERYTCILDIVPVAAPAGDGKKLDESGIYEGPFDAYTHPLLNLFSKAPHGQARRPLIALGLPIRRWIERNWGKSLNILDVDTLTVDGGNVCPVIASNHPSFFYYAVKSYSDIPDAMQKNLAAGLAVMKQDIVAAAWHAEMGKSPESDPSETLAESKEKWEDKDAELLALVKKQAGIPTLVEFEVEAAQLREEALELRGIEPTKQDLAELERQFYAEGKESR